MQQLSGLDASMLYMETRQTPNHVSALYTYDPSTAPGGRVAFDDVLKLVERRLPMSRAFRQRLVTVPLGLDHPYWVEDADFDLEFHVRETALPGDGSWRQLCDLAARIHARPLDLDRPPWELYFIDGLGRSVDGIPSGGFAVLIKLHHAAVDGVAGVELITVLHDKNPKVAADHIDDSWHADPQPSPWSLLGRAGVNNLAKPLHAVRVARRAAPALARVPLALRRGEISAPGSFPRTRFNGPVTAHRSVDGRRAPLAELKTIRTAVPGATVNDAVLAMVGGALRRYLGAKGELPDRSLVALVPVSTRTPDEQGAGGNQIAMLTSTLATDVPDPLERLATVSAGTKALKNMSRAVGARTLSELSNAVPGLLLGVGMRAQSRLAARNRGRPMANTTVTNVPGPQEPLYLCGARVVGPYGAGPIPHGMGLIHLAGSYSGQFSLSFTADRVMMPDPAMYADCIEQSLDELHDAAVSTAAPIS
jgi:WS/DGAT/MGAT family acyltransferase